jgi:hypothetical protein
MEHLRENYWAAEVPEDAVKVSIDKPFGKQWHLHWEVPRVNDNNLICGRCLFYTLFGGKRKYPDSLVVICTTKDATIDQAQQIVEQQDDGFRNYNEDDFHYDLPLMSPFDSLRSLLEAKGLRGKNYCILLKGKDG